MFWCLKLMIDIYIHVQHVSGGIELGFRERKVCQFAVLTVVQRILTVLQRILTAVQRSHWPGQGSQGKPASLGNGWRTNNWMVTLGERGGLKHSWDVTVRALQVSFLAYFVLSVMDDPAQCSWIVPSTDPLRFNSLDHTVPSFNTSIYQIHHINQSSHYSRSSHTRSNHSRSK